MIKIISWNATFCYRIAIAGTILEKVAHYPDGAKSGSTFCFVSMIDQLHTGTTNDDLAKETKTNFTIHCF